MAAARNTIKDPQLKSFQPNEEAWFLERERQKKRPVKASPTTPPPPIGDALADEWFR